MNPLNTILYGPPGTGKTYHSISKAAEIITGESFEDPAKYNEARKLVKHHLDSQDQVEFVTFHQNYSYEDFVAGLRPDTDASSNFLRFTEHRGIFYRLNDRAKRNWEQHRSGQTFTEPSFEEVLEVFLQPLYEDQEIELATIARNANFQITGVQGKGLGFRKKSGGEGHTLSINTLKGLYEGKRDYSLQGLGIYFRPVVDRLRQLAAGMRKETGKIGLKNYVLIIDEINRANISRVFGELITLLEDDKRLGAENELKLRLPGLPEEELFGVAPNLYLVGTMNTADKSIALIDIALRRRFVFEDMYPRQDVINRLLPNPFNSYLLELNEQIKALKGADFIIGHAYFIGKTGNAKEVSAMFNQKIIPLLNEYFYNQRNVDVFNLLTRTQLPGISFEKDPFIGAKAVVI
jgi:5-methylcytosine-specific restriction protein B